MNSAVVLGGSSDAFAINGGRLLCFSASVTGTTTPHIAWSSAASYTGQPSYANGTIYAINGGILNAVSESTGNIVWTWTPPSGSLTGTMIVTNNELFASTGGATYAINLKSHQQDWSYPDGGALALSENKLFITDSSGNLTAINSFFLPTPYVWNLATGGSWATAGNWTPAGPANGIDGTADFSQQALAANATVTLDGSRTIGYMIFGDTAASHNWVLNAGTGGTLTLQVTASSGSTPTITVNNQTATINAVLAGNQGLSRPAAARWPSLPATFTPAARSSPAATWRSPATATWAAAPSRSRPGPWRSRAASFRRVALRWPGPPRPCRSTPAATTSPRPGPR